MAEPTIKIKVTQESFDANLSIDDWFNFSNMTNVDMYNLMLKFVVDDKDKPISIEEARKLFKTVKKSEWIDYLTAFTKAIGDAFVNPTSGAN
jgi:hypothetical protein